jgi:hypothetical protein
METSGFAASGIPSRFPRVKNRHFDAGKIFHVARHQRQIMLKRGRCYKAIDIGQRYSLTLRLRGKNGPPVGDGLRYGKQPRLKTTLRNRPAIVPVASAACRPAAAQSPDGFQRRSGRWRKETHPPRSSTSGQRVDPALRCVKIRRERWYRAKSQSQIDGPWIVLLPLQIQFRTGKRRLREKIVELFCGVVAGLPWLAPRWTSRARLPMHDRTPHPGSESGRSGFPPG